MGDAFSHDRPLLLSALGCTVNALSQLERMVAEAALWIYSVCMSFGFGGGWLCAGCLGLAGRCEGVSCDLWNFWVVPFDLRVEKRYSTYS